MTHLVAAADQDAQQIPAVSPLRTRLAHGATLMRKVAAVAVAAFLVLGIGTPWLLFDAPPSPFEAVALKALCRNATRTNAACPAPTADPARAMAAPATLHRRLK
jgi:hypothetical protein